MIKISRSFTFKKKIVFIIWNASSVCIIHEAQENLPQFYKNMLLSAEYFPLFFRHDCKEMREKLKEEESGKRLFASQSSTARNEEEKKNRPCWVLMEPLILRQWRTHPVGDCLTARGQVFTRYLSHFSDLKAFNQLC